jgi:hypothetical protein
MFVDVPHYFHHEIQSLFTFFGTNEKVIPPITKVDFVTHEEDVSKIFSLREVVDAVMVFLGNSFAKIPFAKVKLEIINLCTEAIAIMGDSTKLQHLMEAAVAGIEKTITHATEVVNVIIHELKRPSDGAFLLKALFEEGTKESSEDTKCCLAMCKKYVAISLKKKLDSIGIMHADLKKQKKEADEYHEEVSYYDDAIIVTKSDGHVMIYLSRV